MICPICGVTGLHCGPPRELSLSAHMYGAHEDELGEEEYDRWGNTAGDALAPLGISNQDQLDAYCAGLGFTRGEVGREPAMNLATKICDELDNALASDYDRLIAAAKTSFNEAESGSCDHHRLLAFYFYSNSTPSGFNSIAKTDYRAAVAEYVAKHAEPKIKAFIQNLQR